jgi:hypothetical protein
MRMHAALAAFVFDYCAVWLIDLLVVPLVKASAEEGMASGFLHNG